MLFNEPKLLKSALCAAPHTASASFSALQRAEIAEIVVLLVNRDTGESFSALQRAEIAEMRGDQIFAPDGLCFSALQRAEIAEIPQHTRASRPARRFQCSSTSRNC